MGQCSSNQQQASVSVSASQLMMIDSSVHLSNKNKSGSRRRGSSSKSKHSSSNKRVAVETGSIDRAVHNKQNRRVVTHDEDSSSQSSRRTNRTALTSSTTSSILDSQQLIHQYNMQSPPSPPKYSSSFPSRNRSGPHRSYQQQQLPQQQQKVPTFAEKYQIHPQLSLGHGIAGQVHQCIHLATSQICAVKTMNKSQIRRKDRIRREISFLKELDHPNIIKMYDVFQDEHQVRIVTEICHGGELFDEIVEKATASSKSRREKRSSSSDEQHQQQPQTRQLQSQPACFSERDAARIIYSLLSAVSYLHANDIIHRDIKPENILFTDKDTDNSPIKLIDFGLSIRHRKNDEPLSNTVGTSYYMSPELLEGEYDRSCDMWSIGVIAYVMLSGRPPFNGSTDPVIFKKIRSGRYRMDSACWDGISDYAKDFIKCLLDMDPNRRWTAHMALNHAWLKLEMIEDMKLMQ